MSNLAGTLLTEGSISKARALSARCLELRREELGPEHRDTLDSMTTLAAISCMEGDFASARELAIQVLESRRRSLGAGHPDSLLAMLNLATIQHAAGERTAFEALMDETEHLLSELPPDSERVQEIRRALQSLRSNGKSSQCAGS